MCAGTGLEEMRRCPIAVVWPESIELLRLYRAWPGTLPFDGGLLDQPSSYLDAMYCLEWAKESLLGAQQAENEAMERLVKGRNDGRSLR